MNSAVGFRLKRMRKVDHRIEKRKTKPHQNECEINTNLLK